MTKFHFCCMRKVLVLAIFLIPIFTLAQPSINYIDGFLVGGPPIDIVNAGDGSNRLFIVEQDGVIEVRNGTTLTQFADFGATGANIVRTVGSEEGLLSMAFHPNYDGVTNRFFFIYYTDLTGNISVTRYQTQVGNIDTVEVGSGTPIITIPHPGEENHNGGKLNFGTDGYLYFATGDGGGGNDGPNNAQTGTVLLGKMLRIDIDNTSVTYGNYSVPPTNPYVGIAGFDERVWALGLRNPFRWSFDRVTGDMWIGDVGQGAQEEINYRPAAATGQVNYGWRCFEGYPSTPGVPDCSPVNYVPPVYDYPNPASGPSAVTGGYVYRGTEFPAFVGYYIAADVYSGNVYLLWPNGLGGFDSTEQTSLPVNIIVGFGEAEDGTLYAASQSDNNIYKVAGTGVVPTGLTDFSGKANIGYNDLIWKTAFEQNTARFHVEYSKDGSLYTRATTLTASGNTLGSKYDFRHFIDNKTDVLYRLKMEDQNGVVSYSKVIRVTGTSKTNVRVFPTVINNGLINLDLNGKSPDVLRILNSNGGVVFKKDIKNSSSTLTLVLPPLAKGIYVVELVGSDIIQRERIVIQ